MRRVSKDTKARVTLTLNGKKTTGEAESRTLLTDFLRHEIGMTGTHVGCEHGVCGCCTVLIDGVAARACLTLAQAADGRMVETVESLTGLDGKLNPLQEALRDHHALQCGFCTPGILMSFTDYLKRVPDPTVEQVKDVLGGHICRCTGYQGLIDAMMDGAKRMRS